jgi:hypothetical protein
MSISKYFIDDKNIKRRKTINARKKGNSYELQIVNELKELGYDVGSSRNESRKMDALKVDIVGDIPFHIQCKAVEKGVTYHQTLKDMPMDKVPVIFHKRNNKGTVVVMKQEDFYIMLKKFYVKKD